MDELKKALADADDDYLTAISNKGVVKRAHKDLETASITTGFICDTADVMVDQAQCVIKVPVAESVCSCPSRTICRHIVTAVLFLRQELLPKEPQPPAAAPEKPLSRQEKLAEELTGYPVEDLVRVMKKKYYNTFLEKVRVGIIPLMEELSSITVDIPEERVTVKLLTPLRYSSCTCGGAMPCKHVAAAILTWKLRHGIVDLNSLAPVRETAVVSDTDKLHHCAGLCLAFLEQLLTDGLVRTSEDAAEYSETNALLCHHAECPEGERLFREIGNRLKAYTAHSPEFSAHRLFDTMMYAHQLMTSILQETDSKKLKELSGDFKSSYQITDELELVPVAKRKFSSITGYEGDIYYFVNKSPSGRALPYLTYSDIRPTYYSSRRSKKSNAPWGLYGLCDVLMYYEMRLTLPKLSGIKLSSSGETQAVQLRKTKLDQKAVYEKVYTDFRKLIEESFRHGTDDEEGETLVMLMPERCIHSGFSEIHQTHTIVAEDAYGQRLKIQARYHSKSRDQFPQLVMVGKRMIENPGASYVIFGNAWLEGGECHIYPIAIFDDLCVPRPQPQPRKISPDPAYPYFSGLFREINEMLCDMVQCGVHSFDLYGQIDDYSKECERSGLTVLSGSLHELSEAFKAGNHTCRQDYTAVIRSVSRIYAYLQAGIRKTDIQCAINRLFEREENENESAR